MGVSSSLYSGVSGLNANANAMSVIGNNIANANTVGFKSSRAIFGDLLSSQISGSGGASQVGRGVGLSIVDNIFSQGTFENTETNTDLAIEGSGFFIVSDPTTGGTGNFYTRAGAFRFDAGGFLVNPEKFNVMGYNLDANGNTVGDLAPIWVNTNSFTQSGPTANVDLNTNLNSDAQTILPASIAAAIADMNVALAAVPGSSTNTAYSALAATPTDPAAQSTALTEAGTSVGLFNTVITAANTFIASQSPADAQTLDDAIVAAGGTTNPVYTQLAGLAIDQTTAEGDFIVAATVADVQAAADEITYLGHPDIEPLAIALQAAIADPAALPADIAIIATNLQAAIVTEGDVPHVSYQDMIDAATAVAAATTAYESAETTALSAGVSAEFSYTEGVAALGDLQTAVADLQSAAADPAFDPLNPSDTSNYATSIQVFDSLGSTHLMTTYFTKTADQQWQWNSVVDGGELTGGTSGELAIVGNGTLTFNASGNLIRIDGNDLYTVSGDTSSDPVFPRPTAMTAADALQWSNGAVQTQRVAIDMQTTQYASPSVVVSQEQDGYGTGTLVKLSIDAEGYVVGNFSNGAPRRLMQMALAKFTNPNALDKIGNNMYSQSTSSGVPVIGTVGSGVGNIFTNALELSNVDLASEFVKMITTQRGFSANSKTITTTDEMLAEVINLKR